MLPAGEIFVQMSCPFSIKIRLQFAKLGFDILLFADNDKLIYVFSARPRHCTSIFKTYVSSQSAFVVQARR